MGARIKTLFVCTANACRSQMAEALMRQVAPERFDVNSAGAIPVGYIHPLAIEAMERLGVPMTGQHSKSWAEFLDRPQDLVITLCSSVAACERPPWTGDPIIVAWPTDDPVAHVGEEAERVAFAVQTAEALRDKITQLAALDFAGTPRGVLTRQIAEIGNASSHG